MHPEIVAQYYADYVVLKKYMDLLKSGNFSDYGKLLQLSSNAKPSVVTIITDTGLATGFFISSDGCIVTNAHEVLGATTEAAVLINGTQLPATLIKVGDVIGNDLAVLKVKGSNFAPLAITTRLPSAGDTTVMIGNPASFGRWVASSGYYLYGVNLTIASVDGTTKRNTTILYVAGISSEGGSGSPLIDMNGGVFGVYYGGGPTQFHGIVATDSVVVNAQNAGFYWPVYQTSGVVPSSQLLRFLEGTPCLPSTYQSSTATSSTQTVPPGTSIDALYANFTKLEQEYKNLASTKFQTQDYTAVESLASTLKPSVVGVTDNITGVGPYVGGTGFFISSDGCIVTNRHVVSAVSKLGVRLVNGTDLSATLVKVSTASGPDLAVLRVKGGGNFHALAVDPRAPTQGAKVLMIGNPSAFGQWVTTQGSFVTIGQVLNDTTALESAIPNAQGASGSPLLSANGTVLGVNFAGALTNAMTAQNNVVIWAGNAGQYLVNASYAGAVSSQDLVDFLKGTSCQPTVSHSGLIPYPAIPLLSIQVSYSLIALWLCLSFPRWGLRKSPNLSIPARTSQT